MSGFILVANCARLGYLLESASVIALLRLQMRWAGTVSEDLTGTVCFFVMQMKPHTGSGRWVELSCW